MANLATLGTLIEMAQERRTQAAQHFAQATQRYEQGLQRVELLGNYRHEYQDKLHNDIQHGLQGAEISNFIRFINQLSQAIDQQHLDNQQLARTQEKAREAFLVEERKLQSFKILSNREQSKQIELANKRDQKLNDEYAARTLLGRAL